MEEEIARRGLRRVDLFDDWVSVLDPAMLEDREPPALPFVDFGEATRSTGWQEPPYFAEDFDYPDTGDLASYSSLWEKWRAESTVQNTSAAVDDERGLIEFTESPNNWSSEGDRTEGDVDVVPDEHFEAAGGTYWEDSFWTAVHDFNPDDPNPAPNPPKSDGHAGVYIRIWNHGTTDQTRFGTIAIRGSVDCDRKARGGICPSATTPPCAALQATFETQSGGFETKLYCFHLTEDPFPWNNTHTYRVQILEKQVRTVYQVFTTAWRAQVWRYGLETTPIGSSSWVYAWDLEHYSPYAVIPDLDGSRMGFAFAPSHQGVRLLSEFTGTTWWVY